MQDFHALLTLMVVIWVAGKIFRSIGLPVVLGELLGGVIVGPLGLALVNPDAESIKLLAELGIFFLMLHAGLENDPRALLGMGKKAVLVALSSMVLPFIVVYFIAVGFGLSQAAALFISTTLSVTAVDISVRILKDCKIRNTNIAKLILGAAVITDILALVLFSLILNAIQVGELQISSLLYLLLKLAAFFGIVILSGFKVQKYFDRWLETKGFTLTLIIALALGLIAESIGLHIIIGAFLAGLFIREEIVREKTFQKIEDRIYGLSYSFLGPIFFASLAFYIDFAIIINQPLLIIVLLFTALLAKAIGASGAAHLLKLKPKQALIIGVAMNAKGAVNLIVATIGFQQEIISKDVFSILILISIISTIITVFILKPLAKHAR